MYAPLSHLILCCYIINFARRRLPESKDHYAANTHIIPCQVIIHNYYNHTCLYVCSWLWSQVQTFTIISCHDTMQLYIIHDIYIAMIKSLHGIALHGHQ